MDKRKLIALISNEISKVRDLGNIPSEQLYDWSDCLFEREMSEGYTSETPILLYVLQLLQDELTKRGDAVPMLERLLIKSPYKVYQILEAYSVIELIELQEYSSSFQSQVLAEQFNNMINEIMNNQLNIIAKFSPLN